MFILWLHNLKAFSLSSENISYKKNVGMTDTNYTQKKIVS